MIMRKIVVLFCLLSLHPAIQSQDTIFVILSGTPQPKSWQALNARVKPHCNTVVSGKALLTPTRQWRQMFIHVLANQIVRTSLGWELIFFTNQSGDSKLRTTLAALSLAYHVRIGNNHKLGLGVSAAYGQLFG